MVRAEGSSFKRRRAAALKTASLVYDLRFYTHDWPMRTNIDIDEALMRRAARLTALKTKREIVHRGLEVLIRLKEQERIRRYRGKLRWRGDLDAGRRS